MGSLPFWTFYSLRNGVLAELDRFYVVYGDISEWYVNGRSVTAAEFTRAIARYGIDYYEMY